MAHELGHTMQTYFSNKNQPYPMAGYPIFVAEVASTLSVVGDQLCERSGGVG